MNKLILTIVLLIISFFIISCSDLNFTISFSEDSIEVTVNEEVQIPITSNIEDLKKIKYTFSNPDMVQFNDNKFIFTEIGELTITAYFEENKKISDSILVKVKDINREISFQETSLTIHKGELLNLEFNLTNLTLTDLAYRLSNENIVSISDDWKVTAKAVGSTTLTVFYLNNDEVYATLPITVLEEKKTIEFTITSITMDIDDGSIPLPIKLNAILLSEVEFIMNKQDIIKVQNGNIVPIKVGTVELKAIYKKDFSVSDKIDIEVIQKNPPLTINDYEYWVNSLDSKYDPKKIILDQNEIASYNQTVFSNYTATKVVDLLNQPTSISKADLEKMINNYANMNSYKVYNNITKSEATTTEKNAILANRNLSAITGTINLQYAIVTNFAALRSYPTNYYSNSYSTDRFQETGLNVGEGAIVYHKSSDNEWYFIQAANYNGWVEAKNIALCSFQEMKDYLTATNFVLVTADKLLINNVYVRMGQRIPYITKTTEGYTVTFPTRDSNGMLVLKDIHLSNELDIHDGYLDYTLENVFRQGFKMLGIPYSWGDKEVDGRDCSSTQNAIYACFGFIMPRNTSNQSKIPTYSKTVSRLTLAQVQEEYAPGTLIFSSGHVLMYIGQDLNGNQYVLHNTSATVAGCKVQTLQSYGINNIIATLKLYND